MIAKLFPYKLQLHIFQLDEYNVGTFLSWIASHFLKRSSENKKPLIWTSKAKAIYFLALSLASITILFLTILFETNGFIIGIFLATQAYIYLVLAYYLLLPIEKYKKNKIKFLTESKLKSFPHLKVIGITGSYGKTSVKEFLYQILKSEYNVLKTPESYNTPYGIAKVIDLEIDKSYDYFICEMGAYRRGEIKEICDMVHPTFGILTGINEQHLNTFGSLENTTLGKFELIDALPSQGFGVINIDNERIKNHSKNYNKKLQPFGLTDKTFTIKDPSVTPKGTTFTLILDGRHYKAHTSLFGKPNLQNILAAATMSYKLGMKSDTIVSAIAQIKPVPHRLEIKELENMTLIDNAYNSNIDGFKESIDLLETFKRTTVFVTPGIVDLGEKTFNIHKALGERFTNIDYVILIGESERTRGLEEGIKEKKKIIKLDSINEVWKKIEELKLHHPVILLENDLPDNY